MDEIKTALDAYSRANGAVVASIEDNNPIKTHVSIVGMAFDAEEALKDAVARNKEAMGTNAVTNGNHTVRLMLQDVEMVSIEDVDALIAQGKIPANIRPELVKIHKREPHISIRPI